MENLYKPAEVVMVREPLKANFNLSLKYVNYIDPSTLIKLNKI